MRPGNLILAALALISAHAPPQDDALKCYLMTRPNPEPLQLDPPFTINPGRKHFV